MASKLQQSTKEESLLPPKGILKQSFINEPSQNRDLKQVSSSKALIKVQIMSKPQFGEIDHLNMQEIGNEVIHGSGRAGQSQAIIKNSLLKNRADSTMKEAINQPLISRNAINQLNSHNVGGDQKILKSGMANHHKQLSTYGQDQGITIESSNNLSTTDFKSQIHSQTVKNQSMQGGTIRKTFLQNATILTDQKSNKNLLQLPKAPNVRRTIDTSLNDNNNRESGLTSFNKMSNTEVGISLKSNKKQSSINNQISPIQAVQTSPANQQEKKVNFSNIKINHMPVPSTSTPEKTTPTHYVRPSSSKMRKMILEEDVKHILSKSKGISIEHFMHKLPGLLDRSKYHFRYLEPEIERFQLEQAKLKRMEKSKRQNLTNVDRMLHQIKNEEIRINRDEKNIGGNELLLQELIKQANLKKGYVTKAQLMKIKLEILTQAAQASKDFIPQVEESKRGAGKSTMNEVSKIHERKKSRNNDMNTSDATIQVLDQYLESSKYKVQPLTNTNDSQIFGDGGLGSIHYSHHAHEKWWNKAMNIEEEVPKHNFVQKLQQSSMNNANSNYNSLINQSVTNSQYNYSSSNAYYKSLGQDRDYRMEVLKSIIKIDQNENASSFANEANYMQDHGGDDNVVRTQSLSNNPQIIITQGDDQPERNLNNSGSLPFIQSTTSKYNAKMDFSKLMRQINERTFEMASINDNSRNSNENQRYMSEKNKSTTTLNNSAKNNTEFKQMLDQVSSNFGYSNPFQNSTSRNKSQTLNDRKEAQSPRGATVIVIPPKNLSARKKEEDPEQESKRANRKEISAVELMKDTQMVERYSQYLSKCLLQTSDPFLRRKYNQYLNKKVIGNEKPDSFYDRMEKDRKRREEQAKLTVAEQEGGRNSQMSRQSRMEDTNSTIFSPNSKVGKQVSPKRQAKQQQPLDSIKETQSKEVQNKTTKKEVIMAAEISQTQTPLIQGTKPILLIQN